MGQTFGVPKTSSFPAILKQNRRCPGARDAPDWKEILPFTRMSAGYIQLVALGQQDAYLTGEPQVTYFSGVYKRHTPFVLEAYDIPFNDQTITFGGTSICHIPPKGDLIRGLTLKMTLPALYNPGSDWTWNTPASSSNRPTLWYGFSNGAIQQVSSKLGSFYYSTNSYSTTWANTFVPVLNYNANTNQFVFNNLSNVIIQSGFTQSSLSTNAQYPVFWGFDPVNYSYQDAYGNLVYTATVSSLSNLTANTISNATPNTFISTLTPDFTLQQAGWIQTAGVPVNSQTGFYAALAQPLALSSSSSVFLNFSALSPGTNTPYWNVNDLLTTTFFVSSGGLVQFLGAGYYTVRLGFNVSAGAVVSISYGATSSPTLPTNPTFLYTYNYTVSPDPTSPAVIPLISDGNSYYYFYVQTNLPCNALPGTYVAATSASDTYQFSSNITVTSGTKVPLYGNTQPSNSTVTLTPGSNVNFSVNGEYLVSGVLSVANAVISNTTEVYATSVTFGNTASSYTYDLSLQGRNPTYVFSIPIVASTTANYWATVTTQSTTSNLLANSFFTIQQIGVRSDTQPQIILPYNGILLQSTSSTLTTPLNLKTNFSSNTNSAIVSINASGNLVFNNVASYMLTGVFYTSSPVTSLVITNSDSTFSQSFNFSLGLAPPYTISVPFRITDTSASYGITLNTFQSGATVQSGTYLTVVPIASNTLIGGFQTYNYYDGVGSIAIVNADLKVGGQTIQSITGEYIEVWNELNVPYENQPGLQLLTGKYDTQTSVGPPGRTYYVNLPYYFYGNPELSLPITALGRQDVEVWVTFNNFSNLTSVSVTNPSLTATIITEYVYLSNPEIDWFQSHRLDYVITQCQYDSFQLPQGFQNAIFDLKFKNPIKELFFLIHPDANLPYNYTTPGGGTDALTFGLTFNGEDAFLTSTINTLYVGAIEPFLTHVNFFSQPTILTSQQPNQYGRQFYMYSFSTNPFGTLSSGQINFSRIRQVLLEMNIGNTALNYPSKTFNIIAISQNILRIENGIGGVMFR
jgi:Large eukaryotic DNA virus major capsid protein/Major capsid protein N-terminus